MWLLFSLPVSYCWAAALFFVAASSWRQAACGWVVPAGGSAPAGFCGRWLLRTKMPGTTGESHNWRLRLVIFSLDLHWTFIDNWDEPNPFPIDLIFFCPQAKEKQAPDLLLQLTQITSQLNFAFIARRPGPHRQHLLLTFRRRSSAHWKNPPPQKKGEQLFQKDGFSAMYLFFSALQFPVAHFLFFGKLCKGSASNQRCFKVQNSTQKIIYFCEYDCNSHSSQATKGELRLDV